MNAVLNNPYRIVGLLVGASAKEQTKQISRLTKYLEADQNPQEDYFFPSLGHFNRTIEHVNEAASKLNLDSDKMGAALFWFYNGNSITDEPAFDAIKEGDLDQVISIWSKLTTNGEVSKRNASAYHNLGTLYLSGILEGTNTNEAILEQGISLKLKFLESDFAKDFKALAADETFKTSKKELQLSFLKQVQSEIEKTGSVTSNGFLDILKRQEFLAKEDFLKGFIQKPIEKIEREIESARNRRKASKSEAAKAGQQLFNSTENDLKQLKVMVGEDDIKLGSISDKLANEILQCSIDYFNESQEKESSENYLETALHLAKQAERVAFGKLTKDRIKDSIETLSRMKDKELNSALELLRSVKNAYETNKAKITAEVHAMPLGFNQTINWSKVNQMIEKSVDWDKVVDLILKTITHKNVEKIKIMANSTQLNEFKNLVDFVIGKLSFLQVNKVKYICYWKTENKVANAELTLKSLPLWAKWCLGIIVFLILVGLIWGEEGIEVVFSIATVLGILVLIGWMKS
jgi:hypothetical protein